MELRLNVRASMVVKAIIRPLRKYELPRLCELCKDHAAYENSSYPNAQQSAVLEKHIFREPRTLTCWVVEVGGEIVGYATFMRQFSTWDADFYLYLDCLYLMPAYRGQGIGKQLLMEINGYAMSVGCQEIQWQTPLDNTQAIKFYQREGAVAKRKVRFFLNAGKKER